MIASEGELRGLMRAALDGDKAAYRTLLDRLSRHLRAYYRGKLARIGRGQTEAEDLVQDTLLRGWRGRGGFAPGTNLEAWLFTILRNLFYSQQRKRKREVEDADGALAGRLTSLPEQEIRVEMREFQEALNALPFSQREALVLVGAQSFTYEEAAAICGVAVGTMKSRVSRARAFLTETLKASDDRTPA